MTQWRDSLALILCVLLNFDYVLEVIIYYYPYKSVLFLVNSDGHLTASRHEAKRKTFLLALSILW